MLHSELEKERTQQCNELTRMVEIYKPDKQNS